MKVLNRIKVMCGFNSNPMTNVIKELQDLGKILLRLESKAFGKGKATSDNNYIKEYNKCQKDYDSLIKKGQKIAKEEAIKLYNKIKNKSEKDKIYREAVNNVYKLDKLEKTYKYDLAGKDYPIKHIYYKTLKSLVEKD